MAKDKPRCMGAAYSEGGLRNRVHKGTSVTCSDSQDSFAKRKVEKKTSFGRSLSALGKERHHSSVATLQRRRVLVDILSGPQKEWRMETHPESETPKPVYKAKKIQDGNTENSDEFSNKGQMGDFGGSARCIPACTHPSFRSEMASLSHTRDGLRIQVPSLWTFNESTGFHPHSKSSSSLSKTSGDPNPRISGRLDHNEQVKRGGEAPPQDSFGYYIRPGIHCKHKEVQSGPVSNPDISRSETRFG